MIESDVYRLMKRLSIDENVLFYWIICSSIIYFYSFIEKIQQSILQFSVRFRLLSGCIHALILVEMKLHYKVKKTGFVRLILSRYLYFSSQTFLVLSTIKVIFSLHLIVMH